MGVSVRGDRGVQSEQGGQCDGFGEEVSRWPEAWPGTARADCRLSSIGYSAGQRILSLLLLRTTLAAPSKDPKREHRLIPILQFVHTHVYRYVFGRPADGLERSVEGEDECESSSAAEGWGPLVNPKEPSPRDRTPICVELTTRHVDDQRPAFDATHQYTQRYVPTILRGIHRRTSRRCSGRLGRGEPASSRTRMHELIVACPSHSSHRAYRPISPTHGHPHKARSQSHGPRGDHGQIDTNSGQYRRYMHHASHITQQSWQSGTRTRRVTRRLRLHERR